MSLMPNPGSKVRLNDGRIGQITQISPLGDNDWIGFPDVEGQPDVDLWLQERISAWDIFEILEEVE